MSTGIPALTPPPVRHLFRAYMTEARYELLRTLRAPAFAGPFLLIPTALYVLFGSMIPETGSVRPPGPYLFTAFTVMGIMGPALFGFGMGSRSSGNKASSRSNVLCPCQRAPTCWPRC